MKLREIAINVYYEPHIYGINESNYDSRKEYLKHCQEYYRNNIFIYDSTLGMQTRNIASFFSRSYFKNFKDMQFPFQKVIISCCKDEANSGKITVFEGIAEVKVLYDYSVFIGKSNEQKKRDSLDIIMKGLKVISENYKTDMRPFEEIKTMIVSADYQNNWVWKTKWNPGRKYKAIVEVEHKVDNADINLKIEDKKGNTIFNKKLITAKPDEWDYAF